MLTFPPEKIVLGLGGTVDYEIELDEKIVAKLIIEYQISESEISNTLPINSERDLAVNLLAFLRSGTGGERFVRHSSIIENFAHRFKIKVTLGGTCVRAAIVMEIFGIASTLHLVSINEDFRRLLPSSAEYVCSSQEDTYDPHLIVQFAAGEKISAGNVDFITPQPNRIIFTNDPPNRDLLISKELGKLLSKARIFLISGFNCIQDQSVLEDRISTVITHLKQLPEDSIVFFEDAGYHHPELSHVVQAELVDYLDVYSMNEEEMQFYLGLDLDLLNPQAMSTAFQDLYLKIAAKILVVHTKHWSVAIGKNAIRYESALRAGMTMASSRYCFGDNFTKDDYLQVSTYSLNRRGLEFARIVNEQTDHDVMCVPGFDLNVSKPSTIGLGDSFVGGFIASLAGAQLTD
jgi:ADP-dependent phosphofructokinase/glucokinase